MAAGELYWGGRHHMQCVHVLVCTLPHSRSLKRWPHCTVWAVAENYDSKQELHVNEAVKGAAQFSRFPRGTYYSSWIEGHWSDCGNKTNARYRQLFLLRKRGTQCACAILFLHPDNYNLWLSSGKYKTSDFATFPGCVRTARSVSESGLAHCHSSLQSNSLPKQRFDSVNTISAASMVQYYGR